MSRENMDIHTGSLFDTRQAGHRVNVKCASDAGSQVALYL